MRAHLRKFLVIAILLIIGIWGIGINPVGAPSRPPGLEVTVAFNPAKINNKVQFTLILTVSNPYEETIAFNKIAVSYVNPDLTVKGPIDINLNTVTPPPSEGQYYVSPGVPLTLSFPFTITTSQIAGGLVPVTVSLWQDLYTSSIANARGVGMGNAVVAGWRR
jgi:hypothetical protein